MIDPESKKILDDIIIGRVEPHIYAFMTNTVPNYLKVGDTYRPVATRLKEWKDKFPELEKKYENSAAINENIFFRDYSVHKYLEDVLKKHRRTREEFPNIYYSPEFFKDVSTDNLDEAIEDIHEDYKGNKGTYQYYDAKTRLPETYAYQSTGIWEPRPNQQETIDKFKTTVENGQTNLLMYAVMRFGKSFTSLCCAQAINAKLILVVSGKADVCEEWKKTVQSAENFKDYEFLTSKELENDTSAITSILSNEENAKMWLYFLHYKICKGLP